MADLSIFKLDDQTINIKDTTARQTADSAKTEVQDIRVKADGTSAATAGNAVREQFTELKNDLNGIAETVIGTNKCDPSTMEDGRYTQINDGVHAPAFVSTSDYILTDYIALDDLRYVFAGANHNTFKNLANGICAFDTNKNAIGSVITIKAPLDIQTIIGYAGAKYIRAWWKKSDFPGQYFIAVSNTAETYPYTPYIKNVVIKENVGVPQVNNVQAQINAFLYAGVGMNKCKESDMDNGRYTIINDHTNQPAWVDDSTRIITDYIEIVNEYLIASAYNTSGNFVPQCNGVAIFDQYKNVLASVSSVPAPVKISDVFAGYNNIKYVRVWWTIASYPSGYMVSFSDLPMQTPYVSYVDNVKQLNQDVLKLPSNWFVGKAGECLGDSITQQFRWEPTTAHHLGCRLINNGIGGTSLSGSSANAFWQDVRVNALSNDADFVIIMGGTNDAARNDFTIGDIARSNNDVSTLCGAYNVLLSKLFYKYLAKTTGYYGSVDYSGTEKRTTAKYVPIYICTPIFCNYPDHDNMDDIADAVKKIASLWGIPCIDINGNCRINAFNSDIYLADGMHPNSDGGILLAQAMIDGMVSNQPFAN